MPFRNDFLNSQSQAMLDKSKGDYLAALSAISNVYDTIGARDYIPQGVKDELNNYKWIQDGVNKLRAAIQATGGDAVFWVPKEMPSGANWTDTEESNALFGIDMAKLFQAGYLKLNEIVEVEGGNPVFYGFTGGGFDLGTKITALGNIASYEIFGFKIDLTKIKALVPKGFDDSTDEIFVPMFPPAIAEELYKKYY
jgi:hypothetical protein